MINERFYEYSLGNSKKIALIYLKDGIMIKKNFLVTGIYPEEGRIEGIFPGQKKTTAIRMEDILTAAYARGDDGSIE